MPTKPLPDSVLKETVDAYVRCGFNKCAAGEELGIHNATVGNRLREAERRGIFVPVGAIHEPPPLGMTIKGVSTLVGADGEVRAQWVKTTQDAEQQQAALNSALEAIKEDIPRLKPLKPPAKTHDDLCNVYTLTDSHVGMLAWRHEGGADWDLKISEAVLTGCFEQMVARSPKAHTAVVAQLGDFLHSDGLLPITPTSGNILDQDGRFEKVVKIAIRILRRVIDFSLKHHEHVHVLMAEGNHDIASSVWLRQMFDALYEDEPRVTVDTSPLPFYALQWGETALFWHHGHLKKFPKLGEVFPAQFPQIWGVTTKRYGHAGHMHHIKVEEMAGLELRQHATLAARDAHASRHAWFAQRHVKGFTYHKKHGEVGSVTVTPEMIEESQ